MIGIKSYGAYLPRYLLPRNLIAKAWDFPAIPGNKTIANIDEDSITMAVEAGLDCLVGIDPKTVDGLYFASTTPPYSEKESASLISTVLDLREDIICLDLTDSTKAATSAVARAYDTIKSNDNINSILVISADMREPEPATMWEYGMSDGAAALLVADEENIAVSIEDYYSISKNVTGPWKRAEKDSFIRTFEVKMDARFYFKSLTTVISELMKKNNLTPKDINTAAYYYDDPRKFGKLAKMMKFPRGVAQNGLFLQGGNFGTPMPLLLLIDALRRPKEGDKIILAGYGDGADAILLTVQDRGAAKKIGKSRMGLRGNQKTQSTVKNYNMFIENRELLEKDRYTRKSSAVTLWRDTPSVFQMYGLKCTNCGTIQYPVMYKSCYNCRADDQFERVKLTKKGEIFTYTLDHLIGGNYYATPVPRCVIDLEGGGRVLCDMTEIEKPEENVEIGMEVELTFRKIHEGANFKNYYWKCRPVRGRE
ncbi:MAG: OB-fold domain-containing protein [Promethearchaeia archaeon]